MISTLVGAKLGAALAAGAVSFGAVGAAAYTGVLPPGLQDMAHASIGAPAADQGETSDATKDAADATKSTAVGPDAKGPAAFGLCTAWAHVQTQGQVAGKSVAFRNLATAAGGTKGIAAYCARVPHPGASAADRSATTAPGKSATHPTGKTSSHPTGKPSTHPTGKPGGTN